MDAPDSMKEFLRYHRRMFAFMAGVCIVVAIILLVVMHPDLSWAIGFSIGSAAQLLKFGLLDVAVIKKIAVERKDAAATQLKAMLMSLALFGLAVLLVFKLRCDVWAMATGIFLPRLILLADTYLRPNPFGSSDDPDGDDVPSIENGSDDHPEKESE